MKDYFLIGALEFLAGFVCRVLFDSTSFLFIKILASLLLTACAVIPYIIFLKKMDAGKISFCKCFGLILTIGISAGIGIAVGYFVH